MFKIIDIVQAFWDGWSCVHSEHRFWDYSLGIIWCRCKVLLEVDRKKFPGSFSFLKVCALCVMIKFKKNGDKRRRFRHQLSISLEFVRHKKLLDTKFISPVALSWEIASVRSSRWYSRTMAILRYHWCSNVKTKSSFDWGYHVNNKYRELQALITETHWEERDLVSLPQHSWRTDVYSWHFSPLLCRNTGKKTKERNPETQKPKQGFLLRRVSEASLLCLNIVTAGQSCPAFLTEVIFSLCTLEWQQHHRFKFCSLFPNIPNWKSLLKTLKFIPVLETPWLHLSWWLWFMS